MRGARLALATALVVAASVLPAGLACARPVAESPPAHPSVRSAAPCGAPAAGDGVVEEYVYRNASRFGRVVRDGRLAGPDCAAVRAFQRWAMIPQVTGSATPITAAVATRLSAARPAACRATGRAVTLCVDLSSQTMWAVRAGRLVLGPTVARTGRRGEATPTGWYRITQRKRYTVSSEYGTPLWFWQRFYRDFGFHAAVTPMYAAVGGSHGCVNLLPRDAAAFWLARRGSRVHVFGRKPGT